MRKCDTQQGRWFWPEAAVAVVAHFSVPVAQQEAARNHAKRVGNQSSDFCFILF